MAICKHNSSKNGFAAALEYLTSQHDPKGRLLRDGEGVPIPRDEYLIQGINCLPETFASCCLQDRINFGKGGKGTVDTHQYIISFAPSDVEKGLTMEEVQRYGYAFAKKNFPGHRVLVCTHPDGGKNTGNIHVHIVISALRFADREPDDRFMRLRSDGSVKPSEYRAGYAHQDTAVLRKYLLAQTNAYCKSRGYVLCPEKAANKITQGEYLLKAKGVETRNDQLRRAVADAAVTTQSWEEFTEKLRTGYTRSVPLVAPIPYKARNQLWEAYKQCNGDFGEWDKSQRAYCKERLWIARKALKLSKRAEDKEKLQRIIADLKGMQARERIYRETYQCYAKAASAALRSQNQEDAQLCVERIQNRWNCVNHSRKLLAWTKCYSVIMISCFSVTSSGVNCIHHYWKKVNWNQ